MSTLSQFAGASATKAIVNAYSSGGVSNTSVAGVNAVSLNVREVLSGALTAGVLKELVSITGAGNIDFLSIYAKNATSRTLRLKVVIDTVTVFDATSNAVSASNAGMLCIGQFIGSNAQKTAPMRFNSSCSIQVASSLTETDLVAIAYSLM